MDARLTQRRLLISALAIVALASVTSACGGGNDARAAPKDPPLATYSGSGLSFSYPTTWTASKPVLPPRALHFHPLVYLSTQAVHAPCTTNGNETTCRLPVDQLQPGGVLAYWEYNQLPIVGTKIALSGKKVQVDGHPAGVKHTEGGACQRIGADRTVEADVDLGNKTLIYLIACLRRPGLTHAEKSIDALLASTKFTSQ
jgi:hypothetical protein